MYGARADLCKDPPAVCPAGGFARRALESGSGSVLRDEVAAHSTPHEVTPRGGKLSGRVEILTLPACRLVFVRYGGEVTVEASATGPRTVATVPLGPMAVRQGRRGASKTYRTGFLLSRSHETVMVPDAWAGAWVVAVDADQLADHRRRVLGAASLTVERGPVTDPLDRGEVTGLEETSLLDEACRQAWALTQLPENTPRPALGSMVRAVESNLLTALVLSSATEQPDGEGTGDLRLDALLDWLEANYQHPITVADMAAVTGLSVRQLQTVFRQTLGRSPLEELRAIRMRHARRMLRAADPCTATVTSVAYRCGFTHPGRFAQLYRCEYGESPSETLARRG